MKKLIGLICLCFVISCDVEPIKKVEEPTKFGSIELEVTVPQINTTSKVPVCSREEGDGSETFIRMKARDENNVEWVIDTKGGVWEEAPYFYSVYTEPIPVGRYTIYELSYIAGGIVRYGAADLAEAELLSQFSPTGVPFYFDVNEGSNNLSMTLFCFYELEEVLTGNIDEISGNTFQWINLQVFLSEDQRNCIEKIRVSFGVADGSGEYFIDPVDYDISSDSPITVIPGIGNGTEILVGLVVNNELVEQKDFRKYGSGSTLTFDYTCN